MGAKDRTSPQPQVKLSSLRSIYLKLGSLENNTPWHKVHIYLEYHSVCTLLGIGHPQPPLPQASVLTPGTKQGGHTRLRVRGLGSQFGRLEKKPSTLSTLCISVKKQRRHSNSSLHRQVVQPTTDGAVARVGELRGREPAPAGQPGGGQAQGGHRTLRGEQQDHGHQHGGPGSKKLNI
jgi:hypothetical protein